jgi:alkylation response protein AidB-like acyl-CoA dehydrogenase
VDLDLSPGESDVATTFETVLARESSVERVRAAQTAGFDEALWKVLTGLGAIGIAVPESAGGSGAGFVELSLVCEAAGRHLASVPFAEAAVAAQVLAEVGGQDDLLEPALAGGSLTVLSPAPAEAGVAPLVPAGAFADVVVALDGDELVIARGGAGAPAGDFGNLGAADRPLRGPGIERRVLATGGPAAELWDLAAGWWRLAAGSAASGVAEGALNLAVAYASVREQFGVPIGTFQAISHKLADIVSALDGGRLVAREASWRHDRGLSDWRACAAVSYAHNAETAVRSAEASLHVHGGYGYTLEYDAQLFLRRAKALHLLAGDPADLWEEIGKTAIEGGADGFRG